VPENPWEKFGWTITDPTEWVTAPDQTERYMQVFMRLHSLPGRTWRWWQCPACLQWMEKKNSDTTCQLCPPKLTTQEG
jgi:hypothetical protein